MADINGNWVDLFLTTTQQMPAPRLFWKILYDPITQQGTAFVGLNNPYQSAESAALDVRCRDICSTVILFLIKKILTTYIYLFVPNRLRG